MTSRQSTARLLFYLCTAPAVLAGLSGVITLLNGGALTIIEVLPSFIFGGIARYAWSLSKAEADASS